MVEMIKFWLAQVIVCGVSGLLLYIGIIAFCLLIDKITMRRR